MSDKYLYDKDGKFIGRVSEKPPNEQNGDPRIVLFFFGFCALFLVFLLPGLVFSSFLGYTRAAFERTHQFGTGSPDWLEDGMKCWQTWVISIAFWGFLYLIGKAVWKHLNTPTVIPSYDVPKEYKSNDAYKKYDNPY
jgi:hypothetical protein